MPFFQKQQDLALLGDLRSHSYVLMDLGFRPAHSYYKCNAFPTKYQMCSFEIEYISFKKK